LTLATAVRDDGATLISNFILDEFPSDADKFNTSLAYQVLSRLSNSLSRLPYPTSQHQELLDNHRREIEKAPAVLEDLSTLLQGGFFDDTGAKEKRNKKKKHQTRNSRPTVPTVAHAEVIDRLSQALGYQAPKSRDSAEQLVQSTLDAQKNVLRVRRATFQHCFAGQYSSLS
jgi:hypothetical protein